MTTTKWLLSAASVCLAAGAAQAGEWRVSRAITGEAEGTAVVAVPLDAHVYSNSLPDLADVRVLDKDGREVPRVIQAEREYKFGELSTPRAAALKSLEQLPDGGLAVVCEIERTNAVSLTRLTLRTPLRDYEQTVTVLVPEAEGAWRRIAGPEPLFDYSRFADVKKTTVALPALTNRLFKLVIGQADDTVFSAYTSLEEESAGKAAGRQLKRYSVEKRPFRIDAVTFLDTEKVAFEGEKRERVPARGVAAAEDTARKETVLTIPAGRCPLRGLALDPEQQNFERQVTVEVPAPGGWRTASRGRVARSRLPGAAPSESLEVTFGEVQPGRLRVRISNNDNPPLSFGEGGVTLLRQAYAAAFIAEKGQRYRLAYGNPEVAAAPVYEQGVTAYLHGGHQAAAWRLAPAPEGAVVYGPGVRVRQFLSERGMLLLSVGVMAALGLLILRAARHAGK
jgi:hypothetical protein